MQSVLLEGGGINAKSKMKNNHFYPLMNALFLFIPVLMTEKADAINQAKINSCKYHY